MNREQERAKRRPKKNPVVEYNKIQNKYYPELFAKFAEVNDPRNQSYIEYPVRVMLGTMYYKCISGISSMQEMTLKFNDDAVVENLYSFMSEEKKEYLPHGVIENEFLARLNPEELEKIQKDIAYSMIRRKTFDDARVLKRWQIIIDATELDEGYQKKNEYYLSRCYNRGEADEFTKYHRSVLEAKLYLGNNLVCSIASEAIQNSEEYINQSEKKIKQDCESKAFIRVAEKIKKQFPRLPIIKPDEKKETTEFAWIADITITKNNARKIVNAGRNRWKIENQRFNRQKHWRGNIEHACSWNEQAQKNHYLMEQIADFIKQLYEYYYLKKNEINLPFKTNKNFA